MSSSSIHFMFPHSLNLVNKLAWNYTLHNKKTSNILIFKVIRYHHKLLCTLNSVVFEVCFFLLFLKSIMITLTVCSFGVIWIMISDPGSLTWFIKGNNESVTREDSSVLLMHHGAPLILIQILQRNAQSISIELSVK